jgi:hypothetical protein
MNNKLLFTTENEIFGSSAEVFTLSWPLSYRHHTFLRPLGSTFNNDYITLVLDLGHYVKLS